MSRQGVSQIAVYGTRWCIDCHRARKVLNQTGTDYEWIDVSQDRDAAARVMSINRGNRIVPTIVFPDGRVLVEPSEAELRAALEGAG